MTIIQLPDEIISQIAAGEVIERPAAVVKELVENSLDSGATQIEIEIEDSGLKKILVKDNGCGISKEDLLLAPLRHATSKIKEFNDLYKITSLGFRGEALASIFSVAHTTIVSKRDDSDSAYQISSEDITLVKKGAHELGTSVIVENLFEKTPARKKYLRTQTQELREIIDVLKRFEVINFDKSFSLRHNNKLLVNKPIFKSQEENLIYTLDKNLKYNLYNLNKISRGISISGFIANPSTITYSFKKNQYLFVNQRFVKSKLLSDAVYEGFSTNLMEGRHPFYVLFIEIDPEIIDVNVHPTKIEIKFENELEIFELVRSAIKEVFENEPIFKPFQKERTTDKKLYDVSDEIQPSKLKLTKKDKNYYQVDSQREFDFVKEDFTQIKKEDSFKENIKTQAEEETKHKGPLYDTLSEYKIIGQLHKTFVIIETPREMLMIDQHVAEEKFYFEKLKENFNSKNPQIQRLLKAKVLELNNKQMLLFVENKELLLKLGFECEEFGKEQIIVRTVPKGIRGEFLEPQLIIDVLEQISVTGKSLFLEGKNENKLASMSCRRSVKAGDELSLSQIKEIIEALRYLKEPFNCPHGRPVLLRYTFNEIEKMFKRH